MACLQICRELLSLATFLRVYSNSKEVSYLCWQNRYPNLKTTCHIKLKYFLWTKLLESLLLTKYLISVTATLMISYKKTNGYRRTTTGTTSGQTDTASENSSKTPQRFYYIKIFYIIRFLKFVRSLASRNWECNNMEV